MRTAFPLDHIKRVLWSKRVPFITGLIMRTRWNSWIIKSWPFFKFISSKSEVKNLFIYSQKEVRTSARYLSCMLSLTLKFRINRCRLLAFLIFHNISINIVVNTRFHFQLPTQDEVWVALTIAHLNIRIKTIPIVGHNLSFRVPHSSMDMLCKTCFLGSIQT